MTRDEVDVSAQLQSDASSDEYPIVVHECTHLHWLLSRTHDAWQMVLPKHQHLNMLQCQDRPDSVLNKMFQHSEAQNEQLLASC